MHRAALASLLFVAWLAAGCHRPQPQKSPRLAGPAPGTAGVPHLGVEVERARSLAARLMPLQQAKGTPHAGDWMAFQHEEAQDLAQYIQSDPNRATAERKAIYVVAIGAFDAEQQRLFDAAAEVLGLFYGLPVKRLDPIDPSLLGPDARRVNDDTHQEQLLTTAIHELLRARRPDDAVAVVALTTADLWPGEGWNFVFGQASLEERVGVWSLRRFGDPRRDAAQVMRRTVQVALHETGHMLGIRHCTTSACGMNGSNSLGESDRNPVHFCFEDEMKVWWACPVEPVARYRALAAFAHAHGLTAEEAFWSRSADALAP